MRRRGPDPDGALSHLATIITSMGGQPRAQQQQMCTEVARAIADASPLAVHAPTGTGKALDVDTLIATVDGWKRMGDLAAGDRVFDERGVPCVVMEAFAVQHGRACYEVTFSDGSVIVADSDHLWASYTATDRLLLDTHGTWADLPYHVVTTAQMRRTLRTPTGRANHAVAVAGPLDLPEQEPEVDPYVLGLWLGDCGTASGTIISENPEVFDHVEDAGYTVVRRRRRDGTTVGRVNTGAAHGADRRGFTGDLDKLGVLNGKHIPCQYLRLSYKQRLALLQGLVDSAGTVTRTGVVFHHASERLAQDVHHLACTLGFRATLTCEPVTLNGQPRTTVNVVGFTTDEQVFRVHRKADAHARNAARFTREHTRFRYVTDVRPVPSRPVRCITVNSLSRLFLAGPTLIPTHNSLAYLVPAVMKARTDHLPVVVATATKSLQQQIIDSDLPKIQMAFGDDVKFAVLKGRSNWLCRAQLSAVTGDGQSALFDERVNEDSWAELLEWAEQTQTGDRAEAPDGTTGPMWSKVSVSANECVGRDRCAYGDTCFAEDARSRAASADVIVTNMHLLVIDANHPGRVIPDHTTVVIDEAHKLAEVARNVLGVNLTARRLENLARLAGAHIEDDTREELEQAARLLADTLAMLDADTRVDPTVAPLAPALDKCSVVLSAAETQARKAAQRDPEPGPQRAAAALSNAFSDISSLQDHGPGHCTWVEAVGKRPPALRSVPVNVAPALRDNLFAERTCVLTSATLAVNSRFDHLTDEVGLDERSPRTLIVDSPFDYLRQAQLYVPKHLPSPSDRDPRKRAEWDQQARELTLQLVRAAGGRSLLLFTSWRRLDATSEWISEHLEADGITLLRQGDTPPRRLIEQFLADETSVLAATQSFWEGVDAPGLSSVLVVVDKIPFPRRGDPLTSARRDVAEQAGRDGWRDVDLPHAATLLAQGTGRLVRSEQDFGIVAVLDPRLANAGYRNVLLDSLPPFWRTVDIEQVTGWLRGRLDTAGVH